MSDLTATQRDKMIADLRQVVADAEELLKMTADEVGDAAVGLRARLQGVARPHLRDLLRQDPSGEAIRIADHCYGCTAGQGSSCGGALEAGAAAHEPAPVPLPARETA